MKKKHKFDITTFNERERDIYFHGFCVGNDRSRQQLLSWLVSDKWITKKELPFLNRLFVRQKKTDRKLRNEIIIQLEKHNKKKSKNQEVDVE